MLRIGLLLSGGGKVEAGGHDDNYGSVLVAHPGKSQGRPSTNPGLVAHTKADGLPHLVLRSPCPGTEPILDRLVRFSSSRSSFMPLQPQTPPHRALGGRTPAEVDHDSRSTLTAQTTKSRLRVTRSAS